MVRARMRLRSHNSRAFVTKIVLCVDDSATMQQVADITFRGTEFTYVGARSYDEGLDKAKSHKPAIVLADSVMPGGKSGYDLCLALKQNDATSQIPVVILIGNSAPYDAAKGTHSGVDANLPKPWDTQTMLEKVSEIVNKGGVVRPGQAAASAPHPAPSPVTIPAKPASPASAAAAAAAAAANAAAMPPRSATIMGMPTIKMPAGVAPVSPPAPTKTTVMAVPPISQSGAMVAPAPAVTTPGAGGGGLRAPAAPTPPIAPIAPSSAPAVAAAAAAPAVAPVAAAAPSLSIAGASRAPMISGTPAKRSAIVERTLAKMGERLAEATGLPAGSPELLALVKLSAEVVERIVWEVVPDLAEQIIRENLSELTKQRS